MSQYGLGRGLDALISRKSPPPPQSQSSFQIQDQKPLEVSIDCIVANSNQPRKTFDDSDLADLAESIKMYGIVQPLVVSKNNDKYNLIAGERRLRAARLIGLSVVPIVVRDSNEHERLAIALIENIQRVNLNPIELGLAYKQLKDEFNLTQDEIAKKVGKSRPSIANLLRILNLPPKIQDALREGVIPESTSRAIMSISGEEEQLSFFEHILKNKLNSDDAAQHAKSFSQKPFATRSQRNTTETESENMLREYLGTKVSFAKKYGKGFIKIEFYSEDELKEIVRKITKDVMMP